MMTCHGTMCHGALSSPLITDQSSLVLEDHKVIGYTLTKRMLAGLYWNQPVCPLYMCP